MAERNGGHDSSQPLITEETTTASEPTSLQQTLNPQHIPFDLISRILLKLPVKSLLRFRCVCKSWNALISDPEFAKDQFRDPTHSTRRNRCILTYWENRSGEILLRDFSLPSAFSGWISSSSQRRPRHNFPYSEEGKSFYYFSGSCHGMLLLRDAEKSFPILWNPATGKFKGFQSMKSPWHRTQYGFGYDHIGDSYKLVALLSHGNHTDVKVHVLGTDSWRGIQGFPDKVTLKAHTSRRHGVFVSGALNWLALDETSNNSSLIVSLDLGTETYQRLLPPDCLGSFILLALAVLKGCLCILAHCKPVSDVWLMKDYGNKDSWTKVFSFPANAEFLRYHPYCTDLLCISDDGNEMLFETDRELVVYGSKSGTFRTPEIEGVGDRIVAEVYAESLISP